MIGLPHNAVTVVPIAVQRPSLAGLATFSLSRRYFAVQLQWYRDVHFQSAYNQSSAAVHLNEVTSAYSSSYVQ